jgi:simple sugar transport system substrate-binding protein
MIRRLLLLAGLLALVAGCGSTQEVREPTLVVRGPEAEPTRAPANTARSGDEVRIAIVTHGQASDPFWVTVRRGIEDAARQLNVAIDYRAPDTFNLERMRRLIDRAVDERPDGIVVTIPDARVLGRSIRRAVQAGIPVVSMNSGSDSYKRLGVLAHVGQTEERAGRLAGERMAGEGVRDALCVNQEVGNQALDERCRAFGAALRKAGGRSKVLEIQLQDPAGAQRKVAEAVAAGGIDGILALGPGSASPALAALRAGGLTNKVKLATFDLSPEVLSALKDGQLLFAIDQQPYLQGYLPVMMLAQNKRFGVFPDQGEVVFTGPHFVTKETADQALALSRRGIR